MVFDCSAPSVTHNFGMSIAPVFLSHFHCFNPLHFMITGVDGIGDVHAVKLISKFGKF